MTTTKLPVDHPCRRRGHAHEERAAEGAAQDRRPADGRACGEGGRRRPAAATSRWWSGTAPKRCARRLRPFAAKAESLRAGERLGTAHAVLAAREAIARGYDDILVMFGDTPLIDAGGADRGARRSWPKARPSSSSASAPPNPTGYGRLIEKGGELVAIREEKDCSPRRTKIDFCNGGLMAIAGSACAGACSTRSATPTPRANIT